MSIGTTTKTLFRNCRITATGTFITEYDGGKVSCGIENSALKINSERNFTIGAGYLDNCDFKRLGTLRISDDTVRIVDSNIEAGIVNSGTITNVIPITSNTIKTSINGSVNYQGSNVINKLQVSTNSGGGVAAHAATHEESGSDEIDVTGLMGLLADDQKAGYVHAAKIGALPAGVLINDTYLKGVYQENAYTYSEDQKNSSWIKTNCIVPVNSDEITASAINSEHYVKKQITPSDSASWIFQAAFSKTNMSWIRLYHYNLYVFYFNIGTLELDNFSGITASDIRIRKDENGRTEVKVHFTSTAGALAEVRIAPAPTSSSAIFVGDGTTVNAKIHYAQMRHGTLDDTAGYVKTAATPIAPTQDFKIADMSPVYSEMTLSDNTTDTVINAQDEWHGVKLLTEGLNKNFTFNAGTDGSVTAAASGGAGLTTFTTSAAHGLAAGEYITQNNFSDSAYVGIFKIEAVSDTTHYTVAATYTATGTGNFQRGSQLTCKKTGVYQGLWSSSGYAINSSQVFEFAPTINKTVSKKALARQKFAWNDPNSFSGNGRMRINTGDVIQFCIRNTSASSNVRILNLTLDLQIVERS